MRSIVIALTVLSAVMLSVTGCSKWKKPPYGTESRMNLPPDVPPAKWAVAPAINLSGQSGVDPLLQADLVYQQLQQVGGLTIVPVNRVVEMYASLQIDKVQSAEQANLVCDLLGVDGLIVPTITIYDPYNPPKVGASLQLFTKPGAYSRPESIDPRELSRAVSPGETESLIQRPDFDQAVGMFDAANGSVRDRLFEYAKGRNDPIGPLGRKEYLVSMDRYCGFVYHELIEQLIQSPRLKTKTTTRSASANE